MRFEKWQALGNDYLIVEARLLEFELSAARVARICDTHFGVGSDGVLLLDQPLTEDAVASLRIFNPDGSEAELSGNGAREAIMYLRHRGFTDKDTFTLDTPAGPVVPTITGPETCTVAMGQATTTSKDFPDGPADGRGIIRMAGKEVSFQHVSIGNPQCAVKINLADLPDLDLERVGRPIEEHRMFPNRTNVSFYSELESGRIRARIFERGVGETLSSGTGASGAAVAYHLAGGSNEVTVVLDGGELQVSIGSGLEVSLTGWARPIAAGELAPEFIAELKELQ